MREPAASDTVEADPDSWEKTVRRDILVGRSVGEYVVGQRIGVGGMGIVYEGRHPLLGRKVAIKILRPDLMGPNDRLLDEARAATSIRHRGVIDVFGFGEIENVGQYMVMEYLEGSSLDAIIAKRAPLPPHEAISILDDTFAALGAAHAAGVIHRDLKPSNLFLVTESSGSRLVKVLDFGLARRTEAKREGTDRPSVIVGTPEYMAPEQAEGAKAGPQSDLYSAGVIAFEMLTGRLPFEGNSALAIAMAHVNTLPPRPSQVGPVPPPLEQFILRLLEKDPARRPSTAEAARGELRRIGRELSQALTHVEVKVVAPPRPEVLIPFPAPAARPPGRESTQVEGPGKAQPGLRLAPLALLAVAIFVVAAAIGWFARPAAPAADPPPPAANVPDVVNTLPVDPVEEAPPDPLLVELPVRPDAPRAAPARPPIRPEVAPPPPVVAKRPVIAPKPGPRPTEPENGWLKLVVRGCWARVVVDGAEVGRAPIQPLLLKPGRHHLALTGNPHCSPYEATLSIPPGDTLVHEVALSALE